MSPARLPLAGRIAGLDWGRIEVDLDARGAATTGPLLTASECGALAGLYDQTTPFRSRVVMARHGFGQGEYKYFADPLPETVETLRTDLYARLVDLANRWEAALGRAEAFPATHAVLRARCRDAGQARPTPLLLRYGQGDYNCLHQDLYGALSFPIQATVLLSAPADFTGGEFVLTEQRPRMQSRAEVVLLEQGEAVLFAVNQRPLRGTRGVYRVTMRHGVSRIGAGCRQTLGVIFHDAQ